MKKNGIALTALLLANGMVGMDGIEHLSNHNWYRVVSVTSTNLTIKFYCDFVTVVQDDSYRKYQEEGQTNAWAHPWSVMGNGEELVLTPNQMTRFGARGGKHTVFFTPVSFKNNQNGFRITELSFLPHSWLTTNNLGYVALSDTPMLMGEEDVEMIMEKEKWKKFEVEKEVEALQIRPENVVPPPEPTATPVNVTEDMPIEEKSKASNLWLYAIIPLGLLVILYLMRRKPAS